MECCRTSGTSYCPAKQVIWQAEARAIMEARARIMQSTLDFGPPYRDILERRGYWTMEEWLHWSETWSVIILQPFMQGAPIIHDSQILETWQALRAIILHFMRLCRACHRCCLPEDCCSAKDIQPRGQESV
ncbi:TPA: hypothetical protein ACH3X2_010806 [Trebouxia sp. C0005]